MSPPSKPPAWASLILPIGAIVFSAGGIVMSARETSAETARVAARLEQHIVADTAPVLASRLGAVETDTRGVEAELREMRKAIERLDGNMIAVCTATRGAQCVR